MVQAQMLAACPSFTLSLRSLELHLGIAWCSCQASASAEDNGNNDIVINQA